MKTTTKTESVKRAMHLVLEALKSGPRSGASLRDDYAARCGSKQIVGVAISELSRARRIVAKDRRGSWVTWQLPGASAQEAA